MRFSLSAILIAALALVSAPPGASAGVFFVYNSSTSCSDAGTGTFMAPYCSITAALNAHHDPGTTIVVLPGVYHEQVSVSANGASSGRISIRALGLPGRPVVVDGADDLANPALWVRLSGSVWRAASVTWSPKQVFAENARLKASTASPAALPVNSFAWVPGSGLFVNLGGDNPGNHRVEAGRRSFGFFVSGSSWVLIGGFTVTRTEFAGIEVSNRSNNITVTHNNLTFANNYGIQAENSTAVLIGANTCSDNLASGIALTAGSTGCTVQDNESFRNPTPDQSNGIYGFGAPGNLIQRNRVHDNAYNGIMMANDASNNVLRQNRVWNNGHQGFEDIFCTGTSHVGDVSYGNYWNGFAIEGGATGTTLYNCVAVDNGKVSSTANLEVDPSSTAGFASDANLFWNSSVRPAALFGGVGYATVPLYQLGTGQDAGTLEADPKFANAAAGDFHPTAGSPLIDAASSGVLNWPTTDADDNRRLDDPATPNSGLGPVAYADRGALEYRPSSHCPASSTIAATLNPTTIRGNGTHPAYLWFNSNLQISLGTAVAGTSVRLRNSHVSINATLYDIPDANITFQAVSCASTSYDVRTRTWNTIVPLAGSDEIFLSGLAIPVTSLAGGANVKWTGTIEPSAPQICVQWKWGAAVYSSFASATNNPALIDYNAALIKPTHTAACPPFVSGGDHAGTPENLDISRAYLGAALGGGGGNSTGAWSPTASVCARCTEGSQSELPSAALGEDPENTQKHDAIDGLRALRPYPNPFENVMHLEYVIAGNAQQQVDIGVYDVAGRSIHSLVNGFVAPGRHETIWDGTNDSGVKMAGGIYFVRVAVGQQTTTRRVLYLKR